MGIPRVTMILLPKGERFFDTREEAEHARMDLIDAGTDDKDIILVEQMSMWDDDSHS